MNNRYTPHYGLYGLHGVRLIVTLLLTVLLSAGNVTAQVRVRGNVYGGGNLAKVDGSVEVNMTGGTVNGDVYGGGAKAHTNIGNWDTANDRWANVTTFYKTIVKLNGGTIEGDAYGGGLGVKAVTADPEHSIAAVTGIEANVYGDVTVFLGCDSVNGEVAPADTVTVFKIANYGSPHADVVKSGRVFGCNNQNGSPYGNVTVNVYKTGKGNVEKTASANLHNESATHTYHVAAVYGGGNLANYTAAAGKKTNVNILTCGVSVESVYGGGNAAAVPETNVLVSGAYEIGYVFGGGNGKDPWTLDGTNWTDNAGADVNGNANTLLTGGFIHEAYGASNQKGNIKGSATLRADDAGAEGCALDVVKMVGAGKNADIDGDAILVMGCMPATKIDQVFGGADNANVNGNVELTITSGSFRQVFGGNNLSGMIKGHIKLNIEETGCRPIEIDELYLGGNEAAYSIYGYYNNGTESAPDYQPRTSEEDHTGQAVGNPSNEDGKHPYPYAQPELNIISCTKIGQVFGGGLGSSAVMHASPTVNINMMMGKKEDPENEGTYITATELGQVGVDFKDKNNQDVVGGVYGGGKQADVYGKTTVNIGTASSVTLTSGDKGSHNVEGARIVSNVYGGGLKADVYGNTEVNIDTVAYTTKGYAGVTIAGDVYGGGEGHETNVTDTAMVNLGANGVGDGTVSGNIYGGSAFGEVATTEVNLYHGTASKSVFGGGKGQLADATATPAKEAYSATITTSSTVSLLGATVTEDIYGGCNVNGTAATTTVKLLGGSVRDAFGGGLGENTGVTNDVLVEVGQYDAEAETNQISGNATILRDVYGGSAKGKVNNADAENTSATKTKHTHVNLYAGTVTGDVYGGGLGYIDNADHDNDIEALVYGDVAVKLNQYKDTAIVLGRVFGCNNLKGTPKGSVTVDVYGTNNSTNSKYAKLVSEETSSDPDYIKATDAEVSAHNYDLAGVFGGGNLANYAPTEGDSTTVTIHGCGTSSIREVYGGGNAADVPGCAVNVYGAYEIGYVYAGGKGQKEGINEATSDAVANVNGNATTTINGGTIYRTFAGANTNGDITGISTLIIAEDTNTETSCEPKLGDVFSYGNLAEMNGTSDVQIGCLTNKVGALYGGAMNANVNNNITLNVNGGKFAKVFGGNKSGGVIGGFIKVNVEQTDCDVEIDELYGCGNAAPYTTAYTNNNTPANYADPEVNIISCDSIGAVYGGGYGAAATVTGNPKVNINMLKATGQTALGKVRNVYGGGNAAAVAGNPIVNIGTLTELSGSRAVLGANITGKVFGGGCSANVTGNTTVNIGTVNYTVSGDVVGVTIGNDVYGAGEGHSTNVTGTATVNLGASGVGNTTLSHDIYGGSAFGSAANTDVHLYSGSVANVFGGGKGQIASGDTVAYVAAIGKKATVTLHAATITGKVYGGCNINGTTAEAELNLLGGSVGTSGVGERVFGGGKGHATTTEKATVNLGSDTSTGTSFIYSNVYGGSALGAVDTTVVNMNHVTTLTGHVFGGGMGEGSDATTAATVTHSATVNQNGITLAEDKDIYGGCNVNGTAAATYVYLLGGTVHDVFGGGLGPNTGVTGNVLVEIGHFNGTDAVSGTATVTHDVYGGSAQGEVNSSTNDTTTVNLWKGTVEGNVYGGGLGNNDHPAAVNGNVRVNLNGYDNESTPTAKGECVVKGSIFGGNNANGSPAGTAEVHIYKTVGYEGHTRTATPTTKDAATYELTAVYGGGNLAAFTGSTTNVIIETCNPSIETVYGGGNAANASNTSVLVKGAYEIGTVFGGGNGEESAANVPGTATTVLNGGLIHDFYGGSNTSGTIGTYNESTHETSGGPVITIDDLQIGTDCSLKFDNIYGAGKSADVDGNISMTMGCLSDEFTVQNLYGGAQEANVKGAVTLTVTSGRFDRVFGGNNVSGTIGGNIEVNLEETGCKPLIIGQVFGGGNRANFGHSTTVNAKSFTSIGEIYGGGNLANVAGSTSVNILTKQSVMNDSTASVFASETITIDDKSVVLPAHAKGDVGAIGYVYGGGFGASTNVEQNVDVTIGSTSDNTINPVIIGDVYGGSALGTVNGKSADASKHTNVTLNKGTVTGSVYGGGLGDKASLGEGHDDYAAAVNGAVTVTVNGGKATNVFGCNNVNGSPQSTVSVIINGTEALSVVEPDIKNVYGGGNQAEYTHAVPADTLKVEIKGGTIGNVYGGGLSANVAGSITVNIKGGKVFNDVYGGGALGHTNTANWNPGSGNTLGEWAYNEVTEIPTTTRYESKGFLASGTDVSNYYVLNNNEYVKASGTATGTTEYFEKHTGQIVAGYYTKNAQNNYVPVTSDWADNEKHYYKRQIVGDWSGTTYKTAVNLTGGVIGNAYGGGLGDLAELGSGHTDVAAIVYGDVTVTLGNGIHATGLSQEVEYPDSSSTAVPISGRVFGCNNINGTPLGNVTVTVNNTQQLDGNGNPIPGHPDNKYDVHSVYGGGNLSRYEPADSKETKVMIDGCDKTSIEKVFGGGNSAAVPKTTVVILGSHHIGYVFGGGNGADKIKKGTTWYANDGAPVYGDATVIAVGGKIGMTFAGSDTKGTVWGNATTKLQGTDDVGSYTSTCPLKITHSYGAGRGADINSDVNFIVNGCTNSQIETIFGGSYDANIRGNINLTITGGVYTNVFGGNDHGGNIGGNITVNVEESETCNPTIIQYLYGGSREATYPGSKAINSSGASVTRGKITVNVKSATRIDNVYGGGWRAVINGDTEVNIDMIKGSKAGEEITLPKGYRGNLIPNSDMTITYTDTTVTVGQTIVTGLYIKEHNDDTNTDEYIQITEQQDTAKAGIHYYYGTPKSTIQIDNKIGTIGNVYGGSYQSEIHGNATVNIGTKAQIDILKRKDGVAGGIFVTESGDSVYNSKGDIIKDGDVPRTVAYVKKDVEGVHITGNVYGGGDLATMDKYESGKDAQNKPTYAGGNTFVNICAVRNGDKFDAVSYGTDSIEGNVYGGGRGLADNFFCRKGMVGHEGDNVGLAPDTIVGTTVRIGNGIVRGSVYGGGEIARVEWGSHVTVGLTSGVTSAPVIEGDVFGGGKGVSTHGYSALLRGDTHVTVQANAKVRKSIYGGGEIASVGRYNVATEANAAEHGVEPGMPYSLFDAMTGQCFVTVQGQAVIGPVAAMTMPTFMGNVFGGGKGVLPYEGYKANENPWRMPPDNSKQYYDRNKQKEKNAYLKYVETLALATRTYVTIDSSAFIKGSVYGGSENGIVQQNTLVKIKGGQIGAGEGETTAYTSGWIDPLTTTVTTSNALKECAHWPYEAPYYTYDMYADKYNSKGGATTGKDGHTYYGNVFGGGCGKDPYRPGEWHTRAGTVGGNTKIEITGGHILTNVYGGNELTNVGTDGIDTTGVCIITMSGGTLGVPRTLDQIKNHPVTCYLFGGGKGDQRVLFNKETNVRDVVVNITGGTIYGSIFGGGEDGHVMRDVTMTIGNNDGTGPKIGTWGTSYVDGNIFGGGRGFSGEAYTAGNVAGSIDLKIKGGTMLGSIYGGGRLASVGYGLYNVGVDGYGEMRDDNKLDNGADTVFYTKAITNWHNLGRGRGHVNISISGGTIGNNYEFKYIAPGTPINENYRSTNYVPYTLFDTDNRLLRTKGGNVFAGGMGRRTKLNGQPISLTDDGIDWHKLGNVKSTKLTISGTPWIKGSVYGGGEFGAVTGAHVLGEDSVGTEIVITGGTIGTVMQEGVAANTITSATTGDGDNRYSFGSIYGGGYGTEDDVIDNPATTADEANPLVTNVETFGAYVNKNTYINMTAGAVRASVYGGGEMACVKGNTSVNVSGGTIGVGEVRAATTDGGPKDYVLFGGYRMGNVYGGGKGSTNAVYSGLVMGNTNVTISPGAVSGEPYIYHNVYGGGAYGSVGTFTPTTGVPSTWISGGKATVTVTGGTIGINGWDNGMVYGSGRGDVSAAAGKDPYDKLAWVHDTEVTIGTSSAGPAIKGSVYGGGENGHNYENAIVNVLGGNIGVPKSGDTWSSLNITTRGNVFGAGCGTNTYPEGAKKRHNAMAGIVRGNTTVHVSGGNVYNSVYGGGSMGSVGTITNFFDLDSLENGNYLYKHCKESDDGKGTLYDFGLSWPYEFTYVDSTGLAKVTVDGTAEVTGWVYGSAQGTVDDGINDITQQRYAEAKLANVRETQVTIGTSGGSATTPTINQSVYGGGEDGHVYENASVTIHHGTIAHSVFGGGKGEGKFSTTLWNPNDSIEGKPKASPDSVYSWTAGRVYGNAKVTMNGGEVGWFIYGGGNMGSVGKGNYSGGSDDYSTGGYGEMPPQANQKLWSNTDFTGSGTATVNLFGGKVGNGSGTDDDGIPHGSVFGGSRGKAAASCKRSPRYKYVPDFFLGYVNNAIINIGGTMTNDVITEATGDTVKIYGSVYGGGQDGHVRNRTEVRIFKGKIKGHTSDASGRSGNVFGAGSGIGTYIDGGIKKVNNSSGSVTCTTLVEVYGDDDKGESTNKTVIKGNVYGGGALASVGPPKTPAQASDEQKDTTSTVKSHSHTRVNFKGGYIGGSIFGASRGPGDSYLSTAPKPVFDTTDGYYDATKYATDIWSYAYVTGGIVAGSVYGGGEGGIVKHDTEVHLTGGTIMNDAYGGGKGTDSIAANVGGNTLVELNNNAGPTAVDASKKGCVVERVFGCNDFKGTPKGHATVHVYATQHKDMSNMAKANKYVTPSYDPDRINTDKQTETYSEYLRRVINAAYIDGDPTKELLPGVTTSVITAATTVLNKEGATDEEYISAAKSVNNDIAKLYDVQAVYGGGNLAMYEPTDPKPNTTLNETEDYAEVIIDGCDYTSIRQVYGGGNAASTPGTYVTVNAAYVIDEVFGGGNGADNYQVKNVWYENPGANVGYYSTSKHEVDGTASDSGTEDKPRYKAVEYDNADTKEERQRTNSPYVYGSGITTTQIHGGTVHRVYGGSNKKGNIREEARSMEEASGDCELHVGETYGAGKSAPIDGKVNQDVKCASGIEEIYGGSKNSDVNADIHLKITNGSSLKRVFGGNNTSGKVNGSITVEIEEGGCEPIHIQELYAGGYLAPYSVYGYEENGSPKTSGDRLYNDPVINVISASRIDTIYGGGYKATVVGNPHINVNMEDGKVIVEKKEKVTQDADSLAFTDSTDHKKYVYKDAFGTIYHKDSVKTGNVVTLNLGTIGNIYGGGNLADIIGDTYVDVGTGEWLNVSRQREMMGISTADNITTSKKFTYNETSKKWRYEKTVPTDETITPMEGTIPSSPTNGSTVKGTTTTITTPTLFTYDSGLGKWTYVKTDSIDGTPTPTRYEAMITGDVFGGGKGSDETFWCREAMVGVEGSGDADPNHPVGGTHVTIGNGKVEGNVYGGGMIGRVEMNTAVTIGLEEGISTPVVEGYVFGAGQGVTTHGYSALVRGNSTVTIQGDAKVKGSVYGGGEKASVGRYGLDNEDMPSILKGGGICTVIIKGNAEIGPDSMVMNNTKTGKPDDWGHVFGAGKGILPEVYSYQGEDVPKRKLPAGWDPLESKTAYFKYLQTLALATETHVTIEGNAFVKGSVYGGSENGFVQSDTYVTIAGGQIGCGEGLKRRYTSEEWTVGHLIQQDESESAIAALHPNSLPECSHWEYDKTSGAPYDPFATYLNSTDGKYYYDSEHTKSAEGGANIGKDGHTFYGNVYGGGSGYYPYAAGEWFPYGGQVKGDTHLTITGGHILTSGYGGNEMTNVLGDCYVTMTGGTLGVPRTLAQIAAHPVTCYLFGSGKGDQRIFFNTSTNVKNAYINISDTARIYGSVFGGGEDAHVLENVTLNIGNTTKSIGNITYPYIGTWGTSYVDGNVFGAGRGFSGDALTAGSVGGNVEVNISGGTMLGSVYGGGRLASVGIGFNAANSTQYGMFQEDDPQTTNVDEGKAHGYVTVNISGGTIGNANASGDGAQYSGNVFGGSMGRLTLLDGSTINPLWPQLGQVKNAIVNVSGTANILRSVFGGGEFGIVRDSAYVTVGGILGNDRKTVTKSGAPTIWRDVYGAGYGSRDNSEASKANVSITIDDKGTETTTDDVVTTFRYSPMQWAGCVGQSTNVNICGGIVKKSVYGGGEMASVGIIDYRITTDANGDFEDTSHNKYSYAGVRIHDDENNGFALSWPYEFTYVDGYNGTTYVNVTGGRIGDNKNSDNTGTIWTDADDYGDVFGGSKGFAGDRYEYAFCANVKDANITVDYTGDNVATVDDYASGAYLTKECITGAVYGGGENGHVIGDTHVTLNNGLIAHALYGGGSGKGRYAQSLVKIGVTNPTNANDSITKQIYSITAGKVFGNTHVKMTGGCVVRNVFGGGTLGSVGKGNYAGAKDDYSYYVNPANLVFNGYGEKLAAEDSLWVPSINFKPEQPISSTNQPVTMADHFLSSGKATVEILGGQVGYLSDSTKDGLPYGNVFGGCRGEAAPNISESPRYWYSPEFFSGYVNETTVIIGDSTNTNANYTGPAILGSVYGGGQDGHVRRDTHVIIYKGVIGIPYTTDNQTNVVKSSDLDSPQWLYRGNVFGAGSGIGQYKFDFNNDEDYEDTDIDYNNGREIVKVNEVDYSTSAGSVTRFTKVEVKGGTIHRNVYGGGSLSSVGPPKIPATRTDGDGYIKGDTVSAHGVGKQTLNEVIIGGGPAGVKAHIGTPDGFVTGFKYNPVYGGEVYGASRGDLSIGESFGTSVWTKVHIKKGANIKGNVFGGGDNGMVKQDTEVIIGEKKK